MIRDSHQQSSKFCAHLRRLGRFPKYFQLGLSEIIVNSYVYTRMLNVCHKRRMNRNQSRMRGFDVEVACLSNELQRTCLCKRETLWCFLQFIFQPMMACLFNQDVMQDAM